MKWLVMIYLSVLVLGKGVAQSQLELVRKLYQQSYENHEAARKLEKQLKNQAIAQNTVLYGYKGISYMLRSKHSFNPYLKLSLFNDGKTLLEEAIIALPENVELRMLRFSVQTHVPELLQYHDHIEEDKKVLVNYLSYSKNRSDVYLYTTIKDLLLVSSQCSKREIESIQNIQ